MKSCNNCRKLIVNWDDEIVCPRCGAVHCPECICEKCENDLAAKVETTKHEMEATLNPFTVYLARKLGIDMTGKTVGQVVDEVSAMKKANDEYRIECLGDGSVQEV